MSVLSLRILYCFMAYLSILVLRNPCSFNGVTFLVAGAAAVCDIKNTMKCANLGNISAPFWGDASCAASDSFVISNCAGGQASWEGALGLGSAAPQVTGIVRAGDYTYINLTWAKDDALPQNACAPSLFSDVDLILPDLINLTSFANGSLQFSHYNYFLLLDCTGLTINSNIPNVAVESPICGRYKQECSTSQFSCAQLKPFQELALAATLHNLSCSRFMIRATSNTAVAVSNWGLPMIQLVYGDPKCQACLDSGGWCHYDNVTHNFLQCSCGDSAVSDSDCFHISSKSSKLPTVYQAAGCTNVFSCHTTAIVFGSVMVTVAIKAVVALCCCLKPKIHSCTKLQGSDIPKWSKLYPNDVDFHNLGKLTERPIEMSYSSIVSATSSFNNILGEGGFGEVYMGTLSGMQIAVKLVKLMSEQTKLKHFVNEVATIGRIHHVHVVRLLGFCTEEHHRILVYEYVSNGSLDRWLFSKHSGGHPKRLLRWEQRYGIAVGIARGLSYLHEECRHRIVHCDIKPQNILLDEKLCPKIADFGLAKLMGRDESRVATMARGTPGYIAPEFWMGGEGHVTTKFDVYSYGMLLLELISGHLNFENGACFPEEAFEAAMEGNVGSIIDERLGIIISSSSDIQLPLQLAAEDVELGTNLVPPYSMNNMWKSVQTALFVALWCIQDKPTSRPHMSEVVQYLEGKVAISEEPPKPTIASIYLSIRCPQPKTYNDSHDPYIVNQYPEQGMITPVSGR